MTLTREQILKADDLPRQEVEVPEWGGAVHVRTLTGAERDEFEGESLQKRGRLREVNLENLRARLCALCIVDADGLRLFNEMDVDKLGGKSAKALDRVFAVAQRMNGFTREDVEELVKNSANGRGAVSTSA